MKPRDWFALIGFIALSQIAGLAGSVFTAPAINGWYSTLVRPELAPPNWVFGPVWTTLFVLMGVAAFLVWKKGSGTGRRLALKLFFAQLVLNTLWSVLFFGMQSPKWALVEIALLWLAIAATIAAFARVSKPAAWLLAPYLAWVTFAAYLNWQFFVLN